MSENTPEKLHWMLDNLVKVFSEIDPNFSLDEFQLKLVNMIREIFSGESGSISLLDQNQDHILIKKTLCSELEWFYQIGVNRNEGILGQCLMTGKPFLTNYAAHEKNFIESIDSNIELLTQSLICAPLISGEKTLGIISVQNKKSGDFTENDLVLLDTIAKIIVMPLLSQKMIQQLQVINAHLEASRWELIRSRNTLRSLTDNIPVSLYIIDRMYRIAAINSSRAKRVQSLPNQLVGKVCFEGLFKRSEPCPECLVSETFFKKNMTNRSERQWQESGESQEWDIGSHPIFDETGSVIQVILVELDVTEKKRMESILAQSEKMAAVGQLAAGIAHEINNPLTVILANAQILQRELPNQEDWKDLAELIHRAGTRALNSVRNLLSFARKEPIDFEPTDINETIERALEMVKHELVERSVSLSFERDDNLPLILGSSNNLQGVWLNLIMNAIDSIEGIKGQIRVRSFLQANEIRISIMDNGHGIAKENINRIFEPFFTTKETNKGTGLGLSICHRVIKQHGGNIAVDSLIGKGSTFTVALPIY
jgi:two-component system, NtrC family, sensor kinase